MSNAKGTPNGSNGNHADNNNNNRKYAPAFPGMQPLEFVQNVLGDKPYAKQQDILRAIQEASMSDDVRRVSVVGCNSSGKDWTAARIILWWLHTHAPAKVIVTGPTARQVKGIVWEELRRAHAESDTPLEGKILAETYVLPNGNDAMGFTSNSPDNIHGFHSPNLLVVVTEAHAVHPEYTDALLRLNPNLMLMVGNAFSKRGEFYDSHHARRARYRTIQITAFDTPNIAQGKNVVPGMITQQHIEERKHDWGEDSPKYITSVLAEFPDNADTSVVPLRVAREAADRHIEPEGEVVVACDIARFGNDKTVVVRRQGAAVNVVYRQRTTDLMHIAGILKLHCEQNRVDTLVIDDVGIGAGVVDRMREHNLPNIRIIPFIGGAKPNDRDHFYNRSAEVWWAMRQRYMDGDISTENDSALIGQVSGREYTLTSSGKIRLQSKRDIDNSPDEADALAMTFAVAPAFRPQTAAFNLWV